jgi:hypothetical protein
MAKKFKIVVDNTEKHTMVYESSLMSFFTDLFTYCSFLIGLSGFYFNHNYCGGSYVLSFVSGIFCLIVPIIGTRKYKLLTKEELKSYIDKL